MAAATNGFLTRTISRIRKATDEPEVNAKYSDTELVSYIESAFAIIYHELSRASETPPTAEFSVDVTSGATAFALPPTIQWITQVQVVNSTTGDFMYHVTPRSRLNPAGKNFRIEGHTLQVDPDLYTDGTTFNIEYIPSGTARLHDATVTAATDIVTSGDNHVVTLASTVQIGTLDTRANAYAGSIFRVLADTGGAGAQNYIQEHKILSYANTTRKITLETDLDPVPAGTTSTAYEIAPPMDAVLDMPVALYVSRFLVGIEGDLKRYKMLNQMWLEMMRDMRLNQNYASAYLAGKVPV